MTHSKTFKPTLVLALITTLAVFFAGGCASIGPAGLPARDEAGAAQESATRPRTTARPAENPVLEERVWLLTGILMDGAMVRIAPGHGTSARIMLHRSGTFEGTSGFNTFNGSWKAGRPARDGRQNTEISVGGTTRMAAPNETAARFERALINRLSQSRMLTLAGGTLTFFDQSGNEILSFVDAAGTP